MIFTYRTLLLLGGLLLVITSHGVPLHAQQAEPVPAQAAEAANTSASLVEAYVAEALASNLALQQRTFDLVASRHALDAARRSFIPTLSVEARFSRAGGGRTIDLPLGDVLNPVYGTLNDLLVGAGQDAAFQAIPNVEVPFLRDQEQETRLRVVQPVYQPQLTAAIRLNRHLVSSKEAALSAYEQQLVRDVKVAYFQYLQAERAIGIFEAAGSLVEENLRTTQRLQRNDVVLMDAVLRAQAETFAVNQQQVEALDQRDRARSYVNFLLNRPLDTPLQGADEIATAAPELAVAFGGAGAEMQVASVNTLTDPAFDAALAAMQDAAVMQRYELDELDAAFNAQQANVSMMQAAYLPNVSVAIDGGIQGEGYGFQGDAPYYLASVVLSWQLFDGSADRSRIRQAQAGAQRIATQRAEAAQQIRLQVEQAYKAVQVARASLTSAEGRVDSATESFRIVQRRLAQGQINQVGFVDARTTLTSAQLNLNVTRYSLLARLAELEFAVGQPTTH